MNDSNSGGKYTIDMTHGPLFGKIIRFVLPLIATYLLQLLFNAADLIVIGHFANHEAMAAVGATTGFNILLLNVFFGLSALASSSAFAGVPWLLLWHAVVMRAATKSDGNFFMLMVIVYG